MMIRKIFNYYMRILSASRQWILLAGIGFGLGSLVGFLSVLFHIGPILKVLSFGVSSLDQLAQDSLQADGWGRIMLIWQNNLTAAVGLMFFGLIVGFIPLLEMVLNGLMLGAVVYVGLFVQHQPWLLALGIVPHGVIELPAIIVAAAFGFKLGTAWLSKDAQGKRLRVLNDTALECVMIALLCAMLLFVAAVIEGGLVFNLALGS